MRHPSQSPTIYRASHALVALAFAVLSFSTCVGEAFALTISGRIYTNEGTTQLTTAGKTIMARFGTTTAGFFATTTVAANGFWQMTNITNTGWASGLPLSVWIDGDSTFRAFTFTKASSTSGNITNLDLYKDFVIVKHEGFTGTSTTNADLGVYDADDDEDIQFRVTGSIFAQKATNTLYIAPGSIYAPGGNVTLHGNARSASGDGDLRLATGLRQDGVASTSILSMGPNNLTLAGNLFASSTSAFTFNARQVTTFTSTSTVQKLIVATSTELGHVVFSGNSGASWDFGANSATTGNFTIVTGTVTLPSPLAPSGLTIKRNFANIGGTLMHNSGTTTFATSPADYLVGRDASGDSASTSNESILSIAISGNYAFVGKSTDATACSQSAGFAVGCEFQVYDISDPANPVYVAGRDSDGSATGTLGPDINSIAISGNYAYVGKNTDGTACSQSAGSADGCEFMVFDITTPNSPTYVAGLDSSGSAAGTLGPTINSIAISGNYAYVGKSTDATACSQTAGSADGCEFTVFNISNPLSPTYSVGRDSDGSAFGTLGTAVNSIAISGNYAYVGKGADATACSQSVGSADGCEFMVFDITTPTSPTYVAGRGSSGDPSASGSIDILSIAISGNYAYVGKFLDTTACSQSPGSADGCEFMVFDITTPTLPTYVAGRDSSGSATGILGLSINAVDVSSGYAYVGKSGDTSSCSQSPGSAGGCEFMVFDITTPTSPTYVFGRDSDGSAVGTLGPAIRSIAISGNYAFVGKNGDGTACSQSPGSADGCEFMVFEPGRLIFGTMTGNSAFNHVNFAANSGNTFIVRNASTSNFFIGANATVTAPPLLSIAGNYSQSGLFLDSVGTVYFSGADQTIAGTMDSASTDFAGTVFLGGGTKTFAANASTSDIAISSAGTTVVAPSLLTIADDYVNSGTFTSGGGTVFFTPMFADHLAVRDSSGSEASTSLVAIQSIAISGNYAYVGKAQNVATPCSQSAGFADGCEFQVWDISSPTSPTYVAGLDSDGSADGTTGTAIQSIAISGNYAYVGKSGGNTACSQTAGSASGCEFMVFDITNPLSPTYAAGLDSSGSSNGSSLIPITSIAISGNYAYVGKSVDVTACSQTAGSAQGCEFMVFNITTPTSPTYAAGRDSSGSAAGTLGPSINSIAISGNYAYVGKSTDATACSQTAGSADGCEFMVFNITTPTSPTYVAGRGDDGGSATINGSGIFAMAISGNYAYVGKTGLSTACSQVSGSADGCELVVFDIASSTNPLFYTSLDAAGSFASTSSASIQSIAISGNYAFVGKSTNATACSQSAGFAAGCEFMIFDFASSTNPAFVFGRDSDGSASGTLGPAVYSIAISGNYAYVGKNSDATICLPSVGFADGCEFMVFDTGPRLSGTMTSGSAWNHLTLLPGNVLFLANASTTNLTTTASSTLFAPPLFSIAGNYTNSGTFTHNSGRVYLSGVAQQTLSGTMTGSSAFRDLTILNTSGTGAGTQSIIFGAAASTTGTFTMVASTSAQFASGAATSSFNGISWIGGGLTSPVWLRSSSGGTPWGLVATNTQAVNWVDVKDSYACAGNSINVTNGIDSGENICWNFLRDLTFSGRIYADEGTTQLTTAGKTISVRIGTSTPTIFATTTVAANGFWQIPNIGNTGLAAGTPIHAWIDNDPSFRAFTFTKASSTQSHITNLDLYKDYVILKHEGFTGTSTTNTDLETYDGDQDADIMLNATTTGLIVNAGQALYIAPGTEFAPGGPVTLHGNASTSNPDGDLHLATGLRQDGVSTSSILTMAGNNLSLAGNFFASSTSLFTQTAAGQTIFTSTSSVTKNITASSSPFHSLLFKGSGTKTFLANASTTQSFVVDPSSGAVVAPPQLTIGGSFTQNGLFTDGGGTIYFDSATTTTGWGIVGSGLSISGAYIPALAKLNATDVAFFDATNDSLRTYRWDGSTWSLIGSGLTITSANNPALAALNATDVAYIDNNLDSLRTYRWNGSTWSQVGSSLAITAPGDLALAALNSTDVAFIDSSNNSLRTYRWSGSTWAQVGSGFSLSIGIPALAALNSTDVVVIGSASDSLSTYRWDGSNWAQVGNSLSVFGAGQPALAAITPVDVAFIDAANESLRTYHWDGATWTQVGGEITILSTGVPALTALNSTDVAFVDSTNGSLRTYRFHNTISGTLNTSNTDLASVVFNGPGPKSFLSNASTTNFTINTGVTVNATTSLLSIAGNYTQNGTSIHNGTVYLTGSSQQTLSGTMTGTSAFKDLTILNTSGTGATQSVVFGATASTTGTFTMVASTSARFLAGATSTFTNIHLVGGGNDSRVWLRSSSAGTPWGLITTGAQNVNYVDVRDSYACTGNVVGAINSLNSTGNSCWDFGGLLFSGTLYGVDETTPITGVSKTIKLAVGTAIPSVYTTTSSSGDGTWSFTDTVSSTFLGERFLAWVDGDSSFLAATFTKASSTDGNTLKIDLFQNRFVVKHEGFTGTSTTNTDLAFFDADNDSDIQFTVNDGALSVNKGIELHIAPGTEFAPGGPVTLHGNASTSNPDGDLHLATGLRQDGVSTSSILTMAGNNLSLAGNFFASSTSLFTQTAAGQTIFTSTSSVTKHIIASSSPFHSLLFKGSGTKTFLANASTTQSFVVDPSSGDVIAPPLLTIGGSFTQNGLFTDSGGTIYFDSANTTTGWGIVGSGFTITDNSTPALTTLSSTDVAYTTIIYNDLSTYRWDGSTWSQVGSTFTLPSVTTGNHALTALSSTDVAYIDSTNDKLAVYRFNGSTWFEVGASTTIATVGTPALATLSSTDVAFFDNTNDSLRTYRWNGSTWSLLGSGLSVTTGTPALAALSSTDVSFIDGSNDSLRTYRWNGSTWSLLGSGLSVTTGTPALAALGSTYVAFVDSTNGSLRAYRWNNAISGTFDTSNTDLANVVFGGTGNKTFLSNASTTNFTVNAGATVNTASPFLSISGNYTNNGVAVHSGTVYLSGMNQQTLAGNMTGTNAFRELTILNTSGTGGGTQSVVFANAASTTGTFTMVASTSAQFASGAATSSFNGISWNGGGVTSPVWLRSSADGTPWGLVATNTQSVSSVNVKDSYACAGDSISVLNSIDVGGNSCWNFPYGIVFSGRVYADEGATQLTTAGKTIALRVGTSTAGIFATSTVAANGFWQITNALVQVGYWGAGRPVSVWVDNDATFRAFTFTKASSTDGNITNLDLYKDRVIVKHEAFNGTSTTNLDLDAFDYDQDVDVPYQVATSGILYAQAGKALYVAPGTTFAPGNAVVLHGSAAITNPDGDLRLASGPRQDGLATSSILQMASHDLTLAGNWFASSSAIFTPGVHQKTTFTSTSTAQKLIVATSTEFNHVLFRGNSGASWSFGAYSATTSNFTIATSTVVAPSSLLTVKGSYANTGGTFTHNSGETIFAGTSIPVTLADYVTGRDSSGSAAGTLGPGIKSIAISGNYAYVGKEQDTTACSQTAGSADGCEFMVFDISTPAAPIYVAGRDSSGSAAGTLGPTIFSIAISGNYAYVGKNIDSTACSQTAGSADGCELMIFNISSSTNPVYSAGLDSSGSAAGTLGPSINSIVISGNYAYVGKEQDTTACSQTPGSADGCEFMVINIASSTNPTYVVGRDSSGSATGTLGPGIKSVAISGNYAYAGKTSDTTACSQTAGSGDGCEFMVFDIATPTAPTYVVGRDSDGSSNGTLGPTIESLVVSGNYAYVGKTNDTTACSQTAGSGDGCEFMVFDISTPTVPTYVAGRDSDGSAAGTLGYHIHSIAISGNYAYVGKEQNFTECSQTIGSAEGCEFTVFDIASSTNPTYVFGRDSDGSATGVWGPSIYSIAISGNYAYMGNFVDATACSQSAGSAQGCEFMVFNLARTLSGTMTGTSAFDDVTFAAGSGSTFIASHASTSNFFIGTSATTIAPATQLTIGGNYTNNGVFTHNAGKVYLSGSNQQTLSGTMTGASAFRDLTILNTSGTGGGTQSVIFANAASTTGTFTMVASTSARFASGAATSSFNGISWNGGGATSPVWLRSSNGGTPWGLVATNTQAVSWVDVQDSYACAGNSISVTNGIDSGGNNCWNFGGAPATNFLLSGRVYTNEGTTQLTTAGKTIMARFGTSTPGFFATSTVAANGFWQMTNITNTGWASGLPLSVWVDGDSTFRAFTITKASSTDGNITGLDLYKNYIIVKHEAFTGTSTTNADLGVYDADDDEDIQFRVTGSNFVANATTTLYVAPGSEFKPGGTVTLNGNAANANGDGDLRLATGLRQDGTASTSILTMESNALDLAGNWYASSTSLFRHAGIVTFNSSSTGNKLIFATSSPFYDISFSGVGPKKFAADATTTGFTIGAGTTVVGPPSLNVGTLTINSGGTLTHEQNSTTQTYTLDLSLTTLTVNSGGKINLSFKGFAGGAAAQGNGPGKGKTSGARGGGAGYGGEGGSANTAPGIGGITYGSTTAPSDIGSGGSGGSTGTGGNGGGAVKLTVSGTLTVNGEIVAHGGNGTATPYPGGGSGGSIWITAGTLAGSGGIGANGGNANNASDGGAGGGGRVALYFTTNTFTGTTTAYGGAVTGYEKGAAGTIFTKAAAETYGDLVVDNNNVAGVNTVASSTSTFKNLSVKNAAQYVIPTGYTQSVASTSIVGTTNAAITVASGAILNASSATSLTNFNLTNNGTTSLTSLTSFSGTNVITNNSVINYSGTTLTIPSGTTWYENGILPTIGDLQPITDLVIAGTMEFRNQSTTTPVSFSTVTVNSGGTLAHQANGSTETDSLNLSLTTLTVNSNGKINVSARGYAGGVAAQGNGPGRGITVGSEGTGAGYGGEGGRSQNASPGGIIYGSTTVPVDIGSGGSGGSTGTGGSGGGGVKLTVSGTATINGEILASGGNGANTPYPGGGSGGSILITAGTLTGAGGIGANGGNANSATNSGAGGGGRVALYYTTSTYTGTTTAYGGGTTGYQKGGAGTIFIKAAADTYGDLVLDNNNIAGANTVATSTVTFKNLTVRNAAQLVIPSGRSMTLASTTLTASSNAGITINSGGTFNAPNLTTMLNLVMTNNGVYNHSGSTLTIPAGSTWYENGTLSAIGDSQSITDFVIAGTVEFRNQSSTTPASFSTVTVNSGGTLAHQANTTAQTDSLNLSLTTLTVNTGGVVDVSGRGFAGPYGAGAGATNGSGSGGGGGYGGGGGSSDNAVGGITFGSTTAPLDIGSGGGNGFTSTGRSGGGAVKFVVSGTATVNGQILASGVAGAASANAGGGGAGGSIWIDAGTLAGNGTIAANGGAGASAGESGIGGGGRIALYYTTLTYSGATTTYGGAGSGFQNGGAGTIFTKAASQTYGDLRINNNSVAGTTTQMTTTTSVNNLLIQNSAIFVAPTSLNIAGNYTNNATFRHNSGTTTFNGASPQTISGNMVGANAFNNLEVTNSIATTSFASAASTTGTFYVTAPNVKLEFTANATSTFQHMYIAGTSGQEISMFSGTPGSRFILHVPGSKTFSFTRIKDSDACSNVGGLTASDSLDATGNLCWSFGAPFNIELLHYRWRFDNGGEGEATSASSAEDVPLGGNSIFVGDRRRLRIQMKNIGAGSASNIAYRLEYASGACSAWTPVADYNAAFTEHWTMDLSPYANNMASTSKYADISTPAGTFVPGYLMTADAQTPPHTLTAAPQYTELEYGIRSRSSVTPDITYCFRVTNAGSETNFTYTQTPQIIVRPNAARAIGGGPAVEESGIPPGNVGGGGQGGGGGGEGSGTPPGNVGGGGGAGGGGGGDSG